MLNYGQRDKKWGKLLIGKSKKTTISDSGCTICACCNLFSKFYYNAQSKIQLTPDVAAKEFCFVAIPEDKDPKYLSWSGTDWKKYGMEFVWRQFNYSPDSMMADPVSGQDTQFNVLKKYMADPEYGIAIQVLTYAGNQHWMAGIGRGVLGWVCADPWLNITLRTAPFPYKRVTGFVIFRRIN